jgi:ketosteroid isomerase-like protein
VTDSANVDLVRSIYADRERGDFRSEWADPEIEWIVADGPTAGRWTGVAGMEESIRGMLTAWDDLRAYADEYREIDDERVLVLTHRTGRGRRSGLEIGELNTRGASVYHLRGGKVTRIVTYYERDRALADLGLEG